MYFVRAPTDESSFGLFASVVNNFARFSGNQVRIETAESQNGRRSFVGKLRGLDEDQILLSVTNRNNSVKELTIPFKKVARAELVLTDDVIRDTLKKRKS